MIIYLFLDDHVLISASTADTNCFLDDHVLVFCYFIASSNPLGGVYVLLDAPVDPEFTPQNLVCWVH